MNQEKLNQMQAYGSVLSDLGSTLYNLDGLNSLGEGAQTKIREFAVQAAEAGRKIAIKMQALTTED